MKSDAASCTPPPSLAGIRVLIVEDEVDSRELVAEALRSSDADVVTASSSKEALEMIARCDDKHRPHVIVSDLGIPENEGFAFIRNLRLLEPESGGRIPVIAVTGYANAEDRQRALAAGFDRHLAKPIDPAVLVEAVAGAARESEM